MMESAVEPRRLQALPVWVKFVIVISAVLMAIGAVIALAQPAMLVAPHAEINQAVRTYAGYLFARNLTLAAVLLCLLIAGARKALGNLVAAVGLIQILDFGVDAMDRRWPVAAGVIVLGVLLLAASARISGAPFWRRAAWD